jgi:hypothetical protein
MADKVKGYCRYVPGVEKGAKLLKSISGGSPAAVEQDGRVGRTWRLPPIATEQCALERHFEFENGRGAHGLPCEA